LKETGGKRGLAEGAGGLAHAVATDAFEDGGGGEGVGRQGGGAEAESFGVSVARER